MRQQYNLYFVLIVLKQYCNQCSQASFIGEDKNQNNLANYKSGNEFKNFIKPFIQQLGMERYQNHLDHKYHHQQHVNYLKTKSRLNLINSSNYDGVEKNMVLDKANINDKPYQTIKTAATQKTPQHHHLHRRHKKRRSLKHLNSVARTPLIIPKEKVLMVKRSRLSSKHIMLTKPYWPWP